MKVLKCTIIPPKLCHPYYLQQTSTFFHVLQELCWSPWVCACLQWFPGVSAGLPWSPVVSSGLYWSLLVSNGLDPGISTGLPWSPVVSRSHLVPRCQMLIILHVPFFIFQEVYHKASGYEVIAWTMLLIPKLAKSGKSTISFAHSQTCQVTLILRVRPTFCPVNQHSLAENLN